MEKDKSSKIEVQCYMCREKFSNAAQLEMHSKQKHQNPLFTGADRTWTPRKALEEQVAREDLRAWALRDDAPFKAVPPTEPEQLRAAPILFLKSQLRQLIAGSSRRTTSASCERDEREKREDEFWQKQAVREDSSTGRDDQ